jgi:hypothetical protein
MRGARAGIRRLKIVSLLLCRTYRKTDDRPAEPSTLTDEVGGQPRR